ncbi:MAG: FKBP-type peptidyl-prolyl cis-trans isomerase [Cytophagaceae bacterium]|jgi:FKBP-type peptidyl-prolyl cis-trans isomerase|nr:FKBP-type peptidyl-prolyl cis-trans isomerase [Cytophagaceae bacterium]
MKKCDHFILVLFMFLSAFVLKAMDTVQVSSGVRYILHKQGAGPLLQSNQQVKIQYKIYFHNRGVPDSILPKAPLKCIITDTSIIAGLRVCLPYFNAGTHAEILIPHPMAYGTVGVEDPNQEGAYIIPPNTDLRMEIFILQVK